MSKRIKYIINSPESLALKKLREKSGLSLRKLADLMDVSFTRVHQLESGRDEVTNGYIEKFLSVTGLNQDDWVFAVSGSPKRKVTFRDVPKNVNHHEIEDIRIQCLKIISKLHPNKLKLALELLSSIS